MVSDQDAVGLVPNPANPGQGKFTGHHKNGDILWLGHFSGGGVIAEMYAYEWDDPNLPGSNCAAANRIKGTMLCKLHEGPGGGTSGYYASVNTGTVPSPWDYTPKSGMPGYFPYNSFMEGGINITQMLGGHQPDVDDDPQSERYRASRK